MRKLDQILTPSQGNSKLKTLNVSRCADELMRYHKDGFPKGKSCGLPALDEHFSWYGGRLYCFSGYDNSGKTSILFWLAVLFVKNYKRKVCIFSPEEDNLILLDELARLYLGKNTTSEYKNHPKCTAQEYADALKWVDQNFMILDVEDLQFNELPNVVGLVEYYKSLVDEGFTMFITDPLNWLNDKNDHETLKENLTVMKLFAKNENIINIYVEHPKTPTPLKDGTIPRATKFNVMNGMMHSKKVDFFVVVHKELGQDINGKVRYENTFDVQKVKSQRLLGMPGQVKLYYEPWSGRFWTK